MAALSGDRDVDEWDEYRLIRSAHRPPRLRRLRGHHLRAITAILLSNRYLLPVGGGGGGGEGGEAEDDSASRGEQAGARRAREILGGGREKAMMYVP